MLARPDDDTPSAAATSTTTRRTSRVISDARAHPPEAEDTTEPVDEVAPADTGTSSADAGTSSATPAAAEERAVDGGVDEETAVRDEAARSDDAGRRGPRLALPLVPLLGGLLVLLLAAVAFLWFTRPGPSDIRTADYAGALQAARSGVVDVTSFDHLTIDDDIEQIRRVTVGDLRDEAVEQIDGRRQQIVETEAVVSTEVLGGGVTAADEDSATVVLLIQSSQQSNASEQAQIVKYRIQVELQRVDDQWRLSGITGR
ncbi:hypothetical protein GCU60_10870 [Blastococcus saxobsidens]|uniref:Mce-associated membrane protein n=1 Tax=Blastococcus saxobsidens TaxID=138336 RepID=A0A6L9W2P6_9ACTN|nr:hypothetical protein [Blastococcus saxobsidens]NEK86258.1 hypothetical protein [Blastococcus saxobsidens]